MILILVRGRRRWPHAHAWYPLLLPIIAFPEAAQLRDLFVDDWRDRYLLAIEAAVFPEPPRCGWADSRPSCSARFCRPVICRTSCSCRSWRACCMRAQTTPFYDVMAATVLGYLTCYVIFLTFPTEGPAHTLRHLHTQPLPDGPLRSAVVFVQKAGTHGNAFRVRTWSGPWFPVIFAGGYAARLVPWLLPLLALMGVGAVYDRYHYASDIIAGAAIVCLRRSRLDCATEPGTEDSCGRSSLVRSRRSPCCCRARSPRTRARSARDDVRRHGGALPGFDPGH